LPANFVRIKSETGLGSKIIYEKITFSDAHLSKRPDLIKHKSGATTHVRVAPLNAG
jgi:hypothetical protein